jgi:hypothetical protein
VVKKTGFWSGLFDFIFDIFFEVFWIILFPLLLLFILTFKLIQKQSSHEPISIKTICNKKETRQNIIKTIRKRKHK